MNKRILFYAFTPFEIISAISIKLNYYSAMAADLILDDSISMRDIIRSNAEKSDIFENVFYCDRSKYFHRNNNRITHEINRIKSTWIPNFIGDTIIGLKKYQYDVFITTEVDYISESIYSIIRKCNKSLEVCLMDEGYSSYTYYFRERCAPRYKKNIIKNMLFYGTGKLYGRSFIAKDARVLYLFEPELQCWDGCPYVLKKIIINHTNLISSINEIFGYNDLPSKEYDKKFIYFEESFFWNSRNNNDIKLIDYIANIVGSENIMIKLHPRNCINRFVDKGYKTNMETGVPWELIAINLDKSDQKVFITFSSGAVLNYKFLVNKSFKTILLYKCIGDEFYHIDDELNRWFEMYAKLYPEQMIIPPNKEELRQYLTDIR